MLLGLLERPSHTGSQIPSLDGLRGVAVALVILSHMSGPGPSMLPAINLLGAGKYGVYLFFALSSFLLTVQHLATPRERSRSPRYWASYGVRRIGRVYPLFTLALAAGLVSAFMAQSLFGPREVTIARHLLLLDGHKIFWAIPVEVKFYLLLPVLLLVLDRVFDRRALPGVVIAVLAVAAVEGLYPDSLLGERRISLPVFLPIFLLGHAAALVYVSLRDRGLDVRVRRAADLVAVLIFAAVLALVPSSFSKLTGTEVVAYRFHGWVVGFGLLWASFLIAYLAADGVVRRLLELRVLRFLGVVSFSAYLWHLPILELVRRNLHAMGPSAMTVVALAAIAAVSTLSYVLVERPCMRAAGRLSRRLEDPARVAVPR